MLPFLKNKDKQSGGISHQFKQADGSIKPSADSSRDEDGMAAVAKDLMNAIKADNHQAFISALRAAFQIMDSEPHSEGPHVNEMDNE